MPKARNRRRFFHKQIRFALKGVRRKIEAIAKGQSTIPANCQIPELRALYDKLGLHPRSGTFIEIGGYDGDSFSNTSFLADQGWRGIYVEPVPDFCSLIRLRHALNKVTVEPVAVDEANSTLSLNLMGTLTTANQDTKNAYGDIPWASELAESSEVIQVKCDSLGNILSRNNVPERFDLMIVDVEGGEEAIIKELIAGDWRPKVLIVELCDNHPDFAGFDELQSSPRRTRAEIQQAGYAEIYSDTINTVFSFQQ